MSGIAGILRFDNAPVEPGLVQTMIATMARRGPDGSNYWQSGPFALGQCMLRTTPESLEETQPLANEAGDLILVMDGRVDNWEELRHRLLQNGAVLRTRADAELVLRAYEAWGSDCLKRIDGDFAFVIVNARARTAFCARDRIGHKSMHYHWDGRAFTFASEPQAILAMPWVDAVPNDGMLAEFIAADWCSRDETFWVGVLRLIPAHCMTVDSGGPTPKCYWEPDLWVTLPYKRDEEFIEHYREVLFDSVRRLSRSHRPVACHVSGGLDSSAVYCVAHALQRDGRLLAPGIQGRGLAFPGHPHADELSYIRSVGRHVGAPIIEDAPTRLLPHQWYVDWAAATCSYPGSPNTTMHLGLIGGVAADGGKVILTGMGGDEWLWTAHRAYYDEEIAQRNWRHLWSAVATDAKTSGIAKTMFWLVRHGGFPQLPEWFKEGSRRLKRQARAFRPRQPDASYWLAPKTRERFERRRGLAPSYARPVRAAGQRYLLDRLYGRTYADLFREHDERMLAANGVEERNPLFTAPIVQLAFSTPDRLRRRGHINKYIHVEALRGLLPTEVIERRGKADFSVVTADHVDHWGPDYPASLARRRPDWVTPEGMARLRRAYEGDGDQGGATWVLWCLYVSEIMSNQMHQT